MEFVLKRKYQLRENFLAAIATKSDGQMSKLMKVQWHRHWSRENLFVSCCVQPGSIARGDKSQTNGWGHYDYMDVYRHKLLRIVTKSNATHFIESLKKQQLMNKTI